MKKLIKIPQNFKYPKIPATQYHFGSGEVVGNILRPDGDWRNYQTPAEEQRRNGVESSACFIEAQQSTIASIMEEQFDIPDQNFSARFNLIFAESNRNGGDPLKGAQTFRDKGLIPDSFLPFSDDIKSWEEFRSFKGGDKDNCESQGRTWRGVWEAKYDVVFTKKEALEEKYRKLRNALKYSPVPLSVYGVTDGVTYIKKPSGVSDTHMVKALFVDDKNQIYIRDTYAPFDKVLPANYNSDFAMRWTVEKQATKEEVGIFIKMLQAISDFLKSFVASPVVMPVPPVVPPIMPPIVAPPVPKYEWDTVAKAKHSVRVICDEEG